MRTDDNHNPTAFTTDLAKQAGLVEGVDYVQGTPFPAPLTNLFTAKLLGDPVAITVKLIDKVGYYTQKGLLRWDYIGIPQTLWLSLSYTQKRHVIGFQYEREGGTTMKPFFL